MSPDYAMYDASTERMTATIAALLQDRTFTHTFNVAPNEMELLERTAVRHGVIGLLFERLSKRGQDAQSVVAALRERAVDAAAWELEHRHVLSSVLERCAQGGIDPLVFKGTALAYGLYAQPFLRVRADTDLLVRPDQRHDADALLTQAGFERRMAVSGEFVSYQHGYSLLGKHRVAHAIDLHWRPINSTLLSQLFDYEELLGRATPLPQLSPCVRMPARVDALIIACLHRLTHVIHPYFVGDEATFGADRLIWLYDIHLLATAMDRDDWQLAVRLSSEKGLCSILVDGLEAARGRFETAYPAWVKTTLDEAVSSERILDYLRSGPLTQYVRTFLALRTVADKARFLRELMLPPVDYMREGYGGGQERWIQWLYVRRIVVWMASTFVQEPWNRRLGQGRRHGSPLAFRSLLPDRSPVDTKG